MYKAFVLSRLRDTVTFFVIATVCLVANRVSATVYYVDSVSGNDANNGTATQTPWRSVTPVQNAALKPGDSVKFKCGSTFASGLTINQSGSSSSPITFTSYGSGTKPIFKKSGQWMDAVGVNGDNVSISNFIVQDSHQAGVALNYGADNNNVSNCEARNVGIGILIRGNTNSVYSNSIHDLKMIVNDTALDNDYGANGVWIEGSYNQVISNTFLNCKAPSIDYGYDGGVIEFWGGSTGNKILRNWSENCQGFVEMGSRNATQSQEIMAYNVSRNNGSFFIIHNAGAFATNVSGLVFENNTVVEQPTGTGYALMTFDAYPASWDYVTVRNNIFYIGNFQYVGVNFSTTHYSNLFYRTNSQTTLGFSLNAGELSSNPLFVNLSGVNYQLQTGSPAINSASNVGYTQDISYAPVPVGGAPDMGAYEKQ